MTRLRSDERKSFEEGQEVSCAHEIAFHQASHEFVVLSFQASSLPLSIIIVGIGNADFEGENSSPRRPKANSPDSDFEKK